MKYTTFQNRGHIDPRSLVTFGVNVKEGENPFGFFGTGLKYAIAVILRHGFEIHITSGRDTFVFTAVRTEIRGKNFDIVHMNGEALGFTTELGKTWELWQAYRELYCNCQDEPEPYVDVAFMIPHNEEDRVIISVSGDAFADIHTRKGEYFVEDEPQFESSGVKVHTPNGTDSVYYRGVKVGKLPRGIKSVRTYNITANIDLTEDRTYKHSFEIYREIGRAVKTSTDHRFIEQALTADDDYFEHHIDFDEWYVGAQPSDAFLEVTGRLLNTKPDSINKSAKEVYDKARPEKFTPEIASLSPTQDRQLGVATQFAQQMGFPVEQYPIRVAVFLGNGVLGAAESETIWVSLEAFSEGTKMVANVLVEEFIHLRYGHKDCSREMQNFLFNRMVSLFEEYAWEGEDL